MKYINKETGDIISSDTYSKLSSQARSRFVSCDNNSSSKDNSSLSVGDGIAIVALSPLITASCLLSAFDL